jgi:hypothetical protein
MTPLHEPIKFTVGEPSGKRLGAGDHALVVVGQQQDSPGGRPSLVCVLGFHARHASEEV